MPQPTNDLDILNFALTLEHFESALYKALIATNLLSGVEAQYLATFGAHEAAHVTTLTQTITTLGGKPVAPLPAYNFPKIATRADLISTIVSVEDLGASAYLGQAPYLQNKDLLEAAVNIHNVEAEHAATWRIVAGSPVAPDPVAKGSTYDDVLKIVTPFLQAPVTAPAATTATTALDTAAPSPSATASAPLIVPPVAPPTVSAPVNPGSVAVTPPASGALPPAPTPVPIPTGPGGFPQLPFTPRRLGNG